jgi:hypothetical protein
MLTATTVRHKQLTQAVKHNFLINGFDIILIVAENLDFRGIGNKGVKTWMWYKSLFAVSEFESCPNPISAGGRSVGLRELFARQTQIESDFCPAVL